MGKGKRGWNLKTDSGVRPQERGEVGGQFQRGSDHVMWKGDAATTHSKRVRARRAYVLHGLCEKCQQAQARERHHKDHDTGNNVPDNIMLLCVKCHAALHPERLRALQRAGAEGVKHKWASIRTKTSVMREMILAGYTTGEIWEVIAIEFQLNNKTQRNRINQMRGTLRRKGVVA